MKLKILNTGHYFHINTLVLTREWKNHNWEHRNKLVIFIKDETRYYNLT
jgi:hypothetical protein